MKEKEEKRESLCLKDHKSIWNKQQPDNSVEIEMMMLSRDAQITGQASEG